MAALMLAHFCGSWDSSVHLHFKNCIQWCTWLYDCTLVWLKESNTNLCFKKGDHWSSGFDVCTLVWFMNADMLFRYKNGDFWCWPRCFHIRKHI